MSAFNCGLCNRAVDPPLAPPGPEIIVTVHGKATVMCLGCTLSIVLQRALDSEDPCKTIGLHTDPVSGRCQSCGALAIPMGAGFAVRWEAPTSLASVRKVKNAE